MSNWAQGDINGSEVTEESCGDFYLRESDQPILCIAGDSGLANTKALLEDALAYRDPLMVVFLFCARPQQDLYCLEQINSMANQWAGEFTFVPVLSEEPADSEWNGAQGLVTDLLHQYASANAQAYLCEPPPMLDAAEGQLQQMEISSHQIFSDRFFDQSSLRHQ